MGGGGTPPRAAGKRPAEWLRSAGRAAVAYPIPTIGGLGLLIGAVLTFAFHQPELGGYVWLATLLVGGLPLVYGTAVRLWHRQFASDVIAAAAIIGSIVLDQPFAGVIIVLMQGGGEALEQYAFRRASASLQGLLERAPRRAQRRTDGGVEEVPVEAVRVGDLLVVRPGDIVPVNGQVVTGSALLDESMISGEPYPRRHELGEKVLSGTVSQGEAFELRASHVSQESEYARMVALVERASHEKPRIQRLADRYAVWFTPLAFALAIGAALYHMDPLTALAVLVVATPCPLLLATPIAVLGGVDKAAEIGLVAKGGSAMEEIARAQAVLFDKTGTLTAGRPVLEEVIPLAPSTEAEVLRWAASLEQLSSHPLAASAIARAKSEGIALAAPEGSRDYAGSGLAGTVEGRQVLVGSRALCQRMGVAGLPVGVEPPAGKLVSLVAVDGRAVGRLVFADPIRPEAMGLPARLRALGVRHIGLVTGDRTENARELAARLDIHEVRAELLPAEKVEQVEAVRRKFGSTVMVGDGVNDAAALAAASLGIAMGAHGAGVSAEAADMVLLHDDIGRVADGIALGQKMLRIAEQGILFGLGASLVLMGIATTGIIPPALGAILQEVIDVAVILNALRVVAVRPWRLAPPIGPRASIAGMPPAM